ncbi:MAG: hypothetical protein ACI9Y1_002404 [Lentisphaeria bacterium]
MNKLILIFLCTLSGSALAANKDSPNRYVNQISVWGHSGDILVQTYPRHAIEGLQCTDDYWLRLNKSDEGFQSMLSMLIAAQMADKPILIRAEDDGDGNQPYCRLQRIISSR